MSNTINGLRRKMNSAKDLQSVVRSMKALAAASIGQYEKSVSALGDYFHTVELGLIVCFRENGSIPFTEQKKQTDANKIGVVVFGSDQGLVGQFNDVVADYAVKTLDDLTGSAKIWTVGDRVKSRLADSGLLLLENFIVPNSVKAITPLVVQILMESETRYIKGEISELHLFYNRPTSGASYEPVSQKLLPLDKSWRQEFTDLSWPTKNHPEIINTYSTTLRAFIREYLFVSLFRACAESLASENASRLAAMQRADKNIEEMLDDLNRVSHRLRQSSIDEELFDVISGFEALSSDKK